MPDMIQTELMLASDFFAPDESCVNEFDDIENYHYQRTGSKKLKDLVINLGSADIFRISCVNHKINLAIRSAIIQHPVISTILKKTSKFCDTIRSAIITNDVCRDLKARLRVENNTRWGSAFLLLEVYKKAVDRGAFDDADCDLPYHISIVELILAVLKPAYILVLNFQTKMANLADVVPVFSRFKYYF